MKSFFGLTACLTTGCAMAISAMPAYSQPRREGDADSGGRRRGPMPVIELPEPTVSVTVEGDRRVIRSNGLPNHTTGQFPNAGNPNALRPQIHEFHIPLHPEIAETPTPARPEFGVALNGVIFDAGTGEFWSPDGLRRGPPSRAADNRGARRGPGGRGQSRRGPRGGPDAAWNYEALGGGVPFGMDRNHAHVQPTGKYHYHGVPTGLVESLGQHAHADAGAHTHEMVHIGWAFDGYPIYVTCGYADPYDPESELVEVKPSYRLRSGQRPAPPDGPGGDYDGTYGRDWEYVEGLGDLDECNGRFGITPEFPDGTYHYFVTDSFPAVPRLWRGTPNQLGRRGGGPGGMGRRPRVRGGYGAPPPTSR